MSKLILLIALGIVSINAKASVTDYLEKAVLIEEITPEGAVKNKFLDYMTKSDDEKSFFSYAPDISSFSWFGACLKEDSSPCKRLVQSKKEFERAFSLSNGRKETDPSMGLPPIAEVNTCFGVCSDRVGYSKIEGVLTLFDFLESETGFRSDKNEFLWKEILKTRFKFLENGPGQIPYNIVSSDLIIQTGNSAVDIILGPISESQFDYLQTYFGMANHYLQFNPQRRYHLIEFMSPILQALLPLNYLSNCFGFPLSYLFSSDNQANVIVGHDSLIELLENELYFRRLKVGEQLQAGDIVLSVFSTIYYKGTNINAPITIDHAQFYIDDNLTLSANPNGFQVGGVMSSRFFPSEYGGMKSFSTLVKNRTFHGRPEDQVGFDLNSLENFGLQMRIYRRIAPNTPLIHTPLLKTNEFIRLSVPYSINTGGKVFHDFSRSYKRLEH